MPKRRGAFIGVETPTSATPLNVLLGFPLVTRKLSIEAFANIYLEAARAIEAEVNGRPIPADCDFPTVKDGVEGMLFIATAVRSAKGGAVWTPMVNDQ